MATRNGSASQDVSDSSRLGGPPARLRATSFALPAGEFVVLSFPAPAAVEVPGLSPGEADVVRAILQGKTNAQIAQERGTSSRTVANQIANVFRKLGVHSRGELAALVATLPAQGR